MHLLVKMNASCYHIDDINHYYYASYNSYSILTKKSFELKFDFPHIFTFQTENGLHSCTHSRNIYEVPTTLGAEDTTEEKKDKISAFIELNLKREKITM